MALGLHARNQRRALRVDVLLRVKGAQVPVDVGITVFNLSRTGFALISVARFRPGERLEFRLAAIKGPSVHVTAAAVHTQSLPTSPGLYVTGFTFLPGRVTGEIPHDAIRELIAAVAPEGFRF